MVHTRDYGVNIPQHDLHGRGASWTGSKTSYAFIEVTDRSKNLIPRLHLDATAITLSTPDKK